MKEGIIREDPWLETENAFQIAEFMSLYKNDPALDSLEFGIEIAELETLENGNSPTLHCLLGVMYHTLPRELSNEFKLMIEKQKLAKTGKEYLLDYGILPVSGIIDSLPNKGRDMLENITAATDYLHSHNIKNYLKEGNALRAYTHLKQSLELSGRNNPKIFRDIIEPNVLLYVAPWVHERLEGLDDTLNTIRPFFIEAFDAARKRVGRYN